eukprot:4652848-Pleurochrysis_carterae.AAC.1
MTEILRIKCLRLALTPFSKTPLALAKNYFEIAFSLRDTVGLSWASQIIANKTVLASSLGLIYQFPDSAVIRNKLVPSSRPWNSAMIAV